jgi:hypothetical protein
MGPKLMNENQDLLILKQFTDILDGLGIEYGVGGSLASSLYGTVRFTQDADLMVEPFMAKAEQFHEKVESDFYINKATMYEAIQSYGSFNIIHIKSVFKIDIFVRPESQYERGLLKRSRRHQLSDSIEEDFSCLSPEDVVILKLRLYKEGGCVSERQWSDVLGVLSVQADSLDYEYLSGWAQKLGLDGLLKRAIGDFET